MITAPSQHDFAAALLVPTKSVPMGLKARSRQDAERRFAVHRNNMVVTLIEALAASFPVTQALVGPKFFRAMTREYVLAVPPRTPVLTEYAIGFPDFVAGFPPAATVPYLADVARIEALRVRAYHAADAAPVPAAAYHELLEAPERLLTARLELHPASSWFRSDHAAYSIWRAHQDLPDMADARLDDINAEHPEEVLICRPELEVIVSRLPDGAVIWLDAVRRGDPLGAAFQQAHAANAKVDDRALFAVLIQSGLAVVQTGIGALM
jgi:hypothetical protein